MKEILKSNKGITLVALIITIIVLLILTTVSIRLVVNQGIIKHAQYAVDKYEEVQNNELQQLNALEEKLAGGKSDWWIATKEESDSFKTELDRYDVETGTKLIAQSDIATVRKIEKVDANTTVSILQMNIKNLPDMFMALDDAGLNLLQQWFGNDMKEKYKWYYGSGIAGKYVEYVIESPIKISDFAENEIYSKSYLGRVIDSFYLDKPWWKMTKEEENALGYDSNIGGIGLVLYDAQNDGLVMRKPKANFHPDSQTEWTSGITIALGEDNYMYPIDDAEVKIIQNGVQNGTIIEKGKWYTGKDGMRYSDFTEYNGPAPCSTSDFSADKIYVRTYLERILASFNK